jgi:transposase
MTKVQILADFAGKEIFVGMDVHKKNWSVSLFYGQEFVRTVSQPSEPEALLKFLRKEFPGARYKCCYESGFCGFWIQRWLEKEGIDCVVVHAADVPKSNKHKANKTDHNDSKSLGQALASGTVQGIYVPGPVQEADRSIVRHRSKLLGDIHRCKNRIKSLLDYNGIELPEKLGSSWGKALVQWLKALSLANHGTRLTLSFMVEELELLRGLLLKVNKELRLLQKEPRYTQAMDLLTSVPGIGPLTAITLLTEIGNINRFGNFRQFNSFVGFYPMEHSSGEHEHKGKITFRHHVALRQLFVEAAWTAIRHDPALLLAFEAWKQKKGSKKAVLKVARKLLDRTWHVWKNNEPYVKGIVK